MLALYLAYFALLLETSDDNKNPRASNRTRRKKKCYCLKRRCKIIENLVHTYIYFIYARNLQSSYMANVFEKIS